ncbi:MAG TPA: pyrroloquinoline quinone-dependent dehydrogenase [Gemmatimonadetes bacterium]|nr:pyrroloquinoline quinone-dependent dehydrogenase [Gemmatimonadota bacterium]HIN77666.1 pyrroloquinoline quinone-dependent dehydrogenase [Gemmatimonadota bacterium]
MTRLTPQLFKPCRVVVRLRSTTRHIGALVVALSGAVPALGQNGASNGEWPAYSADGGSTKYSWLTEIDHENVGDLEIAWRWQARNFGPEPEFNFRVTPIMVDGILYATAGYRRAVVAIDAATGETLWMYRLEEGKRGENAPRLNSGRGVSYWREGADERIFLITPGYHLVSLDAKTGQPVTTFGQSGIVDLKRGLDRPVDPIEGAIGSSSPPVVSNGVVVVGAALLTGLAPVSKENAPGFIRGYDARTGERLWIFHTIPLPGEYGNETWEGDSWSYTGNAGVWAPFSVDDELGYVYLPTEAATGDYYGAHRLGDNLFTQSLVCLDLRTGERVWHYQMVHHGIWDYDNPAPPILVNIEVDGRPLKAVVQVTKQAFAYVFDRVTGEPIWPITERQVASSDIPGERTSPTQPFPTKPAPFDLQGLTLDDLIDFTPELKAQAVEIASQYRIGPLFTPPSLAQAEDGTRGLIQIPGQGGGANWEGAAVDVESGVLYVPSITNPIVRGLFNDPEHSDMNYVDARWRLPGPQGLPLVRPPWGRVTAIDLNTGEHLWMVPNGDTPEYVRDHPALAGIEIPRTGTATRGSTIVTRALLFVTSGDPILRAHDKETGAIVAEIALPARATGVPMTYMVEGRQYIVVAVAGPDHPAELVALTSR